MDRLRRAFINPFTMILFVLAVISFITDVLLVSNFSRNITTVVIICVMILISGAIRLMQELRAKNASDRLERLIHANVTVKRGGVLADVPAEKLVVGDLVFLSAGDRIPADLRLIGQDLFVSQAAVTGESAILEKSSRANRYSELTPLTQLDNLAFMATSVISGKGEGVVLAVGKDTLYGNFIRPDSDGVSAFQNGANSIAWVMLRLWRSLCRWCFWCPASPRAVGWRPSSLLSVAVGLTPEMLPMVVTACLAKAASRCQKRTIVKNIDYAGLWQHGYCFVWTRPALTSENILLEYYMDVLGNENSEALHLAYLNSFYHSGVRTLSTMRSWYAVLCETESFYAALVKRYQKRMRYRLTITANLSVH
ncbi:MAG: hypothetical protein ACLUEQ_12560 [Cloacibacillus evryensis]